MRINCVTLSIAILNLAACAEPPHPPEPDRFIECVYPVDGKRYRMNVSKAPATLAIPGPSYRTFPMPNGREWELTERDAKNYCEATP